MSSSCNCCESSGKFCSCTKLRCSCGRCLKHCECPVPRIIEKQTTAPDPNVKIKSPILDGDRKNCRGCGAVIFFKLSPKTGRRHPYNHDGESHFRTCPKSDIFKKSGKRR